MLCVCKLVASSNTLPSLASYLLRHLSHSVAPLANDVVTRPARLSLVTHCSLLYRFWFAPATAAELTGDFSIPTLSTRERMFPSSPPLLKPLAAREAKAATERTRRDTVYSFVYAFPFAASQCRGFGLPFPYGFGAFRLHHTFQPARSPYHHMVSPLE